MFLIRGLWNECKKLWHNQKLFSLFTVNSKLRAKLHQEGPHNRIAHLDELKDLLSDESFTMFKVAVTEI